MTSYLVTTSREDLSHGSAWSRVATWEYQDQNETTETYLVETERPDLCERMLDSDHAVISYRQVSE